VELYILVRHISSRKFFNNLPLNIAQLLIVVIPSESMPSRNGADNRSKGNNGDFSPAILQKEQRYECADGKAEPYDREYCFNRHRRLMETRLRYSVGHGTLDTDFSVAGPFLVPRAYCHALGLPCTEIWVVFGKSRSKVMVRVLDSGTEWISPAKPTAALGSSSARSRRITTFDAVPPIARFRQEVGVKFSGFLKSIHPLP
jgi:hypothetical protein